MDREMNNQNNAADEDHISDRAARMVENMRAASDAREAAQRRAADFITEQSQRLAEIEAGLADAAAARDDLAARLAASEAAAERARGDHAQALEAMGAEHARTVESLGASAAEEIGRMKAWLASNQAEMARKQADLERDNARLSLESERLLEENSVLAQTAEMLIAAMAEGGQALQRQDALVAEALTREPPRDRPEGSVIRLADRPRPEAVQEGYPLAAAS